MITTFRKQLLLSFIAVAFVPAFLFSVYFYMATQKSMVKELCENNYKVVSHLMDSIDAQFEQASSMTDWICFDSSVSELLKRSPGSASLYDYNKMQVLEHLDNHFVYLPVADYISAVYIKGDNGIDIRRGTNAQQASPEHFSDRQWYQEAESQEGRAVWGPVFNLESTYTGSQSVLPLMRIIKDTHSGRRLGKMIVLYSQKIFERQLDTFEFSKDELIYCVDELGNILYQNAGSEAERLPEAVCHDLVRKHSEGLKYANIEMNGQRFMAVFTFSSNNNRGVIELIPMSSFVHQKITLMSTAVALVLLVTVIGIALSVYLSKNFTQPLEAVSVYMAEVAQGNFDSKLKLHCKNEIYNLGQNMTIMVAEIKKLMREGIEKEREKHDMEMRLLQNQINPHFLYNTLNSIRWLAVMQGAEGISHAVSSLGQLLRYALKDSSGQTQLQNELSMLEEYIYIQNIRYKGKINYSCGRVAPELLECKVPKLILQPLVENAIFHGIEPKAGIGTITLNVEMEAGDILIQIRDNGVGMTEAEVRKLMAGETGNREKGRFSGIGVKNIHERLQILYGVGYGVRFESVEGEFTCAILRLPMDQSAEKGET